jgi:hypothetical protein
MDTRMPRARLLGATLTIAAFATLSAPAEARAQEQQPAQEVGAAPSAEIGPEKLATYTTLHQKVTALRDEYQGMMGRIHDTEGRERVRVELDEKIAALHTEAGITQDEYDRITLMISFDSALREAFEKLMAQAPPSGGDGAG